MEDLNNTVADWLRDAHAKEQQVEKAAQSMRENQVYRLVVLDDRDNMRIRGIVSLNDIVDHDKEQLGGETARGISS